MSKLKNKVAVVTGASKGIGASIVKHFAAEGAKVVVNYASSKEGFRIQASLKLFGDKGGNIINISSGASKSPMAGVSLYSATKAALDAITISLSKELGAKNVRINSVLPGATETEGAASAGVTAGSENEKMFVANTPLGRRG